VAPLNIVLVGEEAAAAQVARAALRAGHRLVAVLSEKTPAVRAAASQHGVAVESPARVRDPAFAADLKMRGVDLLLNVHALHRIDAAVLEAPRLGAFNLHPGPLPRYAGLNGPSWAVLRGET
jgi:UDP-4-amino-4-deoxy-L-arabinose formyltransferase/UDP-glucuronic acid dehydrogenase (UDP-4-keto-hexauronic acid decarboxylating)